MLLLLGESRFVSRSRPLRTLPLLRDDQSARDGIGEPCLRCLSIAPLASGIARDDAHGSSFAAARCESGSRYRALLVRERRRLSDVPRYLGPRRSLVDVLSAGSRCS